MRATIALAPAHEMVHPDRLSPVQHRVSDAGASTTHFLYYLLLISAFGIGRLHPEAGISTYDLEESHKRAMIASATEVVARTSAGS